MEKIVNSIHTGRSQPFEVAGEPAKTWNSAIRKTPVDGPVFVGKSSIAGDEQADLVHHGGPDKAVLAYSMQHYQSWNEEYPEVGFAPGGFGENLTVSGIDESTCGIGDIFRIGNCLLQISQPRQPCWKLSRRWEFPKLPVLVQKTGRTGWYLRVLEEGLIEKEMPIELVERPFPNLTVKWASSVMYAKPRQSSEDLRLAACPALSVSWRTTLLQRATRGKEADAGARLFGKQT